MTLGILSDTHHYFHPNLPDALAGVDLILHAGDLGSLDILDRLEALAPTRAVWGNIDGARIRRSMPEHQRFTLEGLTFWMTHIGGRPGRWAAPVREPLQQHPPDVFICGHSHILRIERVPALHNMLYLNPGAAGQQGFHTVKTCVRLRIEAGRLHEAAVVHLDEPVPARTS